MARAFRTLRSRFARLLASGLVVVSLLGNSWALAQVPAMPVKNECCAGIMAHDHATDGCEESGRPAPPAGSDCDDRCLVQCQSTVVLPMVVAMAPVGDLAQVALPPLFAGQRPLADPGPDLRPPISA